MTTQIKISGTKVTAKITPKYPAESVRKLDNTNGAKGKDNKPHAHTNLFKWFRRVTK